MIRTAIAMLAFATLIGAADREQFTLQDGRVIVGSYDEASATLTMESPRAALHVDARDIIKREVAPTPVEPAKSEPRPAKPAKADGPPAYVAEAIKRRKVATEARATADLAERDAAKAYTDAMKTFWETADLSPVTVHVPENPTQADLSRARGLTDLNRKMAEMAKERAAGRYNNDLSTSDRGLYAEAKGVAWLADF